MNAQEKHARSVAYCREHGIGSTADLDPEAQYVAVIASLVADDAGHFTMDDVTAGLVDPGVRNAALNVILEASASLS